MYAGKEAVTMRSLVMKLAGVILLLVMVIGALPSCSKPAEAADSYVAVVPEVLHSGRTEAISLALFAGDSMVKNTVEVRLLQNNKEIASAKQTIDGKGTINLNVPDVEDGVYDIQVKGEGFNDTAQIRIEKSFIVFIETDKPIYKPGQTVHVRVMTLDPELKPESEDVTVDILDAKGIKVFRQVVTTDEYGFGNIDLPVSGEPNLGVWKIVAVTEKATSQIDFNVEEYVLPKYEVSVDLPREWFLVDEEITGKVDATYSFGKPVTGEMTVVATRYVGEWKEFATVTKDIDGSAGFEIPAVGYGVGTPAGGGNANVQLDVTVTEKSTGYVEKTSLLLTVSQSSTNIRLVPEGEVFKPGLTFRTLVVTETPDNSPVDAEVTVAVSYLDDTFSETDKETRTVTTSNGLATLELSPPADAVAMTITAQNGDAYVTQTIKAAYSPSGSFIHIQQTSEGTPDVGDKISFRVYATDTAVNYYYEVISRGMVVSSDYTTSRDITITTTPLMASTSRLLVYRILPNSEVAADYLPFEVNPVYPQQVSVQFSEDEVEPADTVDIDIETEGKAKVGLAAVDKSVFILAENRLNLQQVFAELERLYMEPQAEIHDISFYPSYTTPGAEEIFESAGVIVMTNKEVPQGTAYEQQGWDKGMPLFGGGIEEQAVADGLRHELGIAVPAPTIILAPQSSSGSSATLAEVQRVRQFFPETWIWTDTETDSSGKATMEFTVPDTITTWMLRAVAISPENGLGVAEDSLVVFQPFFLTADLPYSAIRGEEFPVSIAVYNYLDETQTVQVDLEASDWFELLDESSKTIEIGPNDIGGVTFTIRPVSLGVNDIKVSARSSEAADAMIKTVIIEPEGVSRELVENITLAGGITKSIETSIPDTVVPDSGRAYIALTSSFLTQTIDGLDALLQMPFGCGEQNMMLFAPDVFIMKYLQGSGQVKPEIMAKAEKLMVTGYQRELTYMRNDGSFSAFGESDDSGSLWLTAFVLKSFAQAKGLIYIDNTVLNNAADWILDHQNADGSFDQVGFIHHQELLGGLQGKEALTAYVAIALLEAGETNGAMKAVTYLENNLDAISGAYGTAITAYALELAQSSKAGKAYDNLMALARNDENGLYWGDESPVILEPFGGLEKRFSPEPNRSAGIETTAYATLALVMHGDAFNASQAANWLVAQRNAYGGYGSTQDTVVALQALTEFATGTRSDVDLIATISGNGFSKEIRINSDNYDVLQVVEVPVDADLNISVEGKGDAIAQVVRRFNLPEAAAPEEEILTIDVGYDTTRVEVNDKVTVSVSVSFNPPAEFNIAEAGMTVVDISIPTGFQPVAETLESILARMDNIKRYEVAGRKVIFYVENMKPGDTVSFEFQVQALYPVKAKGVASSAYAYYQPDIKAETLGEDVTVNP